MITFRLAQILAPSIGGSCHRRWLREFPPAGDGRKRRDCNLHNGSRVQKFLHRLKEQGKFLRNYKLIVYRWCGGELLPSRFASHLPPFEGGKKILQIPYLIFYYEILQILYYSAFMITFRLALILAPSIGGSCQRSWLREFPPAGEAGIATIPIHTIPRGHTATI